MALISVVASIVGHKSAEGLVPACAYVGEMGIVSRVAVFDTANYPRNALACDDSVKVGLGQMMLVERVVPVWDSRKQRLGRSLRNIRLWRHDARCQYISPEMNPHFTRGTATGIFDDHPCGNGVVGRNLFSPNSPRPDPRSLSRNKNIPAKLNLVLAGFPHLIGRAPQGEREYGDEQSGERGDSALVFVNKNPKTVLSPTEDDKETGSTLIKGLFACFGLALVYAALKRL